MKSARRPWTETDPCQTWPRDLERRRCFGSPRRGYIARGNSAPAAITLFGRFPAEFGPAESGCRPAALSGSGRMRPGSAGQEPDPQTHPTRLQCLDCPVHLGIVRVDPFVRHKRRRLKVVGAYLEPVVYPVGKTGAAAKPERGACQQNQPKGRFSQANQTIAGCACFHDSFHRLNLLQPPGVSSSLCLSRAFLVVSRARTKKSGQRGPVIFVIFRTVGLIYFSYRFTLPARSPCQATTLRKSE